MDARLVTEKRDAPSCCVRCGSTLVEVSFLREFPNDDNNTRTTLVQDAQLRRTEARGIDLIGRFASVGSGWVAEAALRQRRN